MSRVKRDVPPLPPLNLFHLSHIIETVSEEAIDDLNDSIEATNKQYATDVEDQMNRLTQMERGLLTKLENIEKDYRRLHNMLETDVGKSNNLSIRNGDGRLNTVSNGKKVQLYTSVGNKLGTVVDGIISQRNRVESLTQRLKSLDKTISFRKGRLFDINSEHKDQFKELYEYGMNDELVSEIGYHTKEKNINHPIDQYSVKNLDGATDTIKDKVKDVDEDHKPLSKVKLQQYLDIEMQLDEIERQHEKSILNKYKNPTAALFANEIATTEISDKIVTIRNNKENSTGLELVKELKKLTTTATTAPTTN